MRWKSSPSSQGKRARCLGWVGGLLVTCALWGIGYRLRPPSGQTTQLTQQELNLIAKPVVVAVRSRHFFGESFGNRNISDCSYQGYPITCTWTETYNKSQPDADALWYHLPAHALITGSIKDAPHQLTVGMSMEGAAYYPQLDKMEVMDHFDIEMTYRLCSHIPVPYYFGWASAIHSGDAGFQDPVPWQEKISAIAYVNSNCDALNGRNDIVKALMNMKKVPVHAHGRCLNTHPHDARFEKATVFRQYKFCIAMENSNSQDYVTEKIWQALESGCLPIYMGAPNIMDFVPHKNSFIDYNDFDSPETLMELLERLSNDQAAYDAYMSWKYLPAAQLNPAYLRALEAYGSPVKSKDRECMLCQLLMDHRLHPRNFTGTHCLRNQTWLATRDKGGAEAVQEQVQTAAALQAGFGGRRGGSGNGVA